LRKESLQQEVDLRTKPSVYQTNKIEGLSQFKVQNRSEEGDWEKAPDEPADY